jgi:hypothetical protein
LTIAGFLTWGALSDERPGLQFSVVAGHRQCSLSRVSPWVLMSTIFRLLERERERERERENRKLEGGSEKRYVWGGGLKSNIFGLECSQVSHWKSVAVS